MPSAVRECRWCRVRQVVRLDTDGRGGVVEEPLPCGCAELRARGVCIGCRKAPVEGTPGRALRCAPCKVVANRDACRRWKERHPDRHDRVQRTERRRRRSAAGRARRREYDRARRSDPEFRARRNARRRQLGLTARGREQRGKEKRLYKERHPERVKAQQDRANARRAAEKREYMHLYATRYVGEGKKPTCRSCGAEVPWSGRGRPRKECRSCDPARWRRSKAAA